MSHHELASVDGSRNTVLGVESVELVQQLMSLDVPLALLNDAPVPTIKVIWISQWNRYFKVVVFPSEVGVVKPDPEIYRIVRAEVTEYIEEIPTKDVIFFDDRERNIHAAVDAGWGVYLRGGAGRARAVANNRLNELRNSSIRLKGGQIPVSEISFRDATLVHDGVQRPSVSNLNLTINDGEFVALVGPSGNGKPTTLRMIAGLEPTIGGDIIIGGQSMRNVAPSKRDIAMVFQTYALYPHTSAARNMSFVLKTQKVSGDVRKKRIYDIVAMLDLESYLDRKPKKLSGGQRQRVIMGRVIVRHPRIFLTNEPLSNLDAKLRVSTYAQIVDLQRRLGITTVYVTHDQTETMTMTDRIAVLADGQLQQVGSPRELYDNPGNEFVVGFLDSPSMNTCGATVEGNRLLLGGKQIPFPKQFMQTLPKSVVFDIRSEYLRIVSSQGAKADVVAPVLHIEDTGADVYIRITIAEDTMMVVRGEVRQVPAREGQVGICFDRDGTHWFDSADRKALVR